MSELPVNTAIETTAVGDKMRVTISMTLETPDHAHALIEAIRNAIIPILQIALTGAAPQSETEAER